MALSKASKAKTGVLTLKQKASKEEEFFPCALSIAGLDPGGGAGIAADLRAFHKAGVFGASALTLTTKQSTNGLKEVYPLSSETVLAQCTEVLESQHIKAIKVGALGTSKNVVAVANLLRHSPLTIGIPYILDPVMVPSIGKPDLLDQKALKVLREELLPSSTLVTANVPEAEALSEMKITSLDHAIEAASHLCALGANAVMVKGGHLKLPKRKSETHADCIDVVVFDDGTVMELRTERLPIDKEIHGGGCTLSSLIAGRIARGDGLMSAIKWSKQTLLKELYKLKNVGGKLRVISF